MLVMVVIGAALRRERLGVARLEQRLGMCVLASRARFSCTARSPGGARGPKKTLRRALCNCVSFRQRLRRFPMSLQRDTFLLTRRHRVNTNQTLLSEA